MDSQPAGWYEHVFADENGRFSPEDDENSPYDYELSRLLDAKETLAIVHAALEAAAEQDRLSDVA